MTLTSARPRLLTTILLGVLLLAGTHPRRAAAGPAIIDLDEIRPGMTGYGLTVFAGGEVDTFSVIVVGVQERIRAAGSVIIIEVDTPADRPRVVAQGMSGSPIFLEDRLAGALAFGWAGALRPLAGVTPAAELLAIGTDAPTSTGLAAGIDPARWPELLAPGGGDLARTLGLGDAPVPAARETRSRWPSPEDLALELMTPLLPATDAGPAWICRPAGLAATAGAAAVDAEAPAPLVPGAACAIPLVLGDAQLGAIGTVTWVEGRDVHMMGHPFMQRGPVRMPLATAEILTVFPSRQMSFKLGSIGKVVGAVHQDRRAGIAGKLGAQAPLLPVRVTVTDPLGTREYAYEVVDDPLLNATLVFWSAYNSLLARGDDASLQTVRWQMSVRWLDRPDGALRTLEQSGATAGPGGVASLGSAIMAPLSILVSNPFAPVTLAGVDIRLEAEPGLATATVLGLDAPRRVRAGSRNLAVVVEVEPRRGARERVTLDLALPAGLVPGPYRLVVATAAEFFALEGQRAAGRFQPADLGATLDLLDTERGYDTLRVALLAPGRGLVVRGRELDALPGSLARSMRRGAGRESRTLADFVAQQDRTMPWLVLGHAVLDLQVIPVDESLEPERRP